MLCAALDRTRNTSLARFSSQSGRIFRWSSLLAVSTLGFFSWLPFPADLCAQESSRPLELDDPTLLIEDLQPEIRTQVEKRTAELIRQLGDESYSIRQSAQTELSRIGMLAFDQLREAMINEDPQVASSAHFLLQSIQQEWAWESDPVEVKEVLTGYASASESDRASSIDRLAKLNTDVAIGALCRICRYETHEHLSKHAAISILRCKIPAAGSREASPDATAIRLANGITTRASRAAAIRETVGNSHRIASQWLLKYAEYLDSDNFDTDLWKRFAADDRAQWSENKNTTTSENVVKLYRWICKQLIEHQQRNAATEVAESMVEVLPKNSIDIFDVCSWALSNEMPELVERLANQHSELFSSNTKLRYSLAESLLRRDNPSRAETLAEEAFRRGMAPSEPIQPRFNDRCDVAFTLQSKGLHDWAEREYDAAIQGIDPLQRASLNAFFEYCQLLGDGQKYDRAAKVWKSFAERLESEPLYRNQIDSTYVEFSEGRASDVFIERYYYYMAMDAKHRKDTPAAVQLFEKSVLVYEQDSDAWIELYRLASSDRQRRDIFDRTLELRRSLRKQIDEAEASLLEGHLDRSAYFKQSLARSLNELAWLLASTEGDLAEALRCALRANEVVPTNSSYLDTLARVYFRLGKIDDAIRYQELAIEVEPHSRQLKRTLNEYQQAAG